MKYIVIDYYDDPFKGEVVGEAETVAKVKRIIKQRIKDTDGECDLEVHDENGNKYI